MKYVKYLPLLAVIMLASCRLDPAKTFYTNVVVPIDERSIPGVSFAGAPFNIYAHVTLDSDCWSNIRFFFDTIEDRSFQIFAIADYMDEGGGCTEMMVYNDTVISLTADLPGKYYFRTWLSAYEYELDSLNVVEPEK